MSWAGSFTQEKPKILHHDVMFAAAAEELMESVPYVRAGESLHPPWHSLFHHVLKLVGTLGNQPQN